MGSSKQRISTAGRIAAGACLSAFLMAAPPIVMADDDDEEATPVHTPDLPRTSIRIEMEKEWSESSDGEKTRGPFIPEIELRHIISKDMTLFAGANGIQDFREDNPQAYGVRATYFYLQKSFGNGIQIEAGKFRSLRGLFRMYEIDDVDSVEASENNFNNIALRGQTGIRLKYGYQINDNLRADFAVSATRSIAALNDTIIGKKIKATRGGITYSNVPSVVGTAYLTHQYGPDKIQAGVEAARLSPGPNSQTAERSVGVHGIYTHQLNDNGAYASVITEAIRRENIQGFIGRNALVYNVYGYIYAPINERVSAYGGIFSGQDTAHIRTLGVEGGLKKLIYGDKNTNLSLYIGAARSRQSDGVNQTSYNLGIQYRLSF